MVFIIRDPLHHMSSRADVLFLRPYIFSFNLHKKYIIHSLALACSTCSSPETTKYVNSPMREWLLSVNCTLQLFLAIFFYSMNIEVNPLGNHDWLVDPRVGMTQNSFSKHTKKFLLVTFCDTSAGIEASFGTDRDGWTGRSIWKLI